MKVLLISDLESEYLWDYYQPGHLAGVDLILSCGDLHSQYLSFLVTMGGVPLLYVHGNHDQTYDLRPPEGCECIEDRLITVKGLRVLGLGGSIWYSGGPHQYTEAQMARRVRRLRRQLRRAGGVDIVVTHAPARGYGDAPDQAHHGFSCFGFDGQVSADVFCARSCAHELRGQNSPNDPAGGDYDCQRV